MRKILFISAVCLLLHNVVSAQTARLNISIAHFKFPGRVFIMDPTSSYADLKNSNTPVTFDKNGNGTATIDVPQVKYVMLNIYPSDSFDGLDYQLFLSPGDNMTIKIDFRGTKSKVTIDGQGSNNNRIAFKAFTDIWADNRHSQDKSPYPALNIFKNELSSNRKIFDDLLRQTGYRDNGISQNKPSDDFIRITRYNLDYYLTIKFFELKSSTLDDSHFSGPWQKVQDSLFKTIKLNNDDALSAYNYQSLLTMFMLRERERLWRQQEKDPISFYKEWYHTTNLKEGERLFTDERKNLLSERIINRYFTGKTAEYLYVKLLKDNLKESNYQNIGIIFDHFKTKYPADAAIKMLRGPIATIVERQKRKLNDKMIFAADNGTKLNSLKEVTTLFKGKTVLIDMWGTWCGPCREDIENHTDDLHSFFKNGDVQFLYIANFDLKHEDQWKKLIAYYGIEGHHVLANEKLSKDIMAKTKSNAFPTYIILKKDGTFSKAKSQYPMQEDAMVKELLAAEK